MDISISVVICTHDRPDSLRTAVESLTRQAFATSRYEVIVVDSASRELAAPALEKSSLEGINLVCLREEEPGLSRARNAGIQAARGELVAFMDDDAEADRGWLEELWRACQENPGAWAVGGKVLPAWDSPRPAWLSDALSAFLSLLDLSTVGRCLSWPEMLVGTNIAFRRQLFDRVGQFSPALGRTRTVLRSGDETELQNRMYHLGLSIYYQPTAVVTHHIPADRLEKGFFYRRAYWQGYTESVQAALENRKGGALSVVRQALLLLARGGAAALLYPFTSEAERLRRRCMVESRRGALQHARDHAARRCDCWNLDERPVQY